MSLIDVRIGRTQLALELDHDDAFLEQENRVCTTGFQRKLVLQDRRVASGFLSYFAHFADFGLKTWDGIIPGAYLLLGGVREELPQLRDDCVGWRG